ncbi:MAG: TAXI family TRAP transporter solute-binding subunit [Rhodospirillales bacterium]
MRSHPSASIRCRWVVACRSILLVAGLAACAPIAPGTDVVIGTGSPSGAYYPLGGSICRLFNLESARDGRRCAAVPSDGPIANLEMLRDGRIDAAIVQSDVLVDAVAGVGAFATNGRNPDLRVLFAGHSDAFTIVARRELEVRGAAELRGKRINMGSPGSGERVGMERIMAALGTTRADFSEVHELSRAEQHRALCANELDAIVYSVAHPNGLIQDVVNSCRGGLVDLSGPAVDDMLRRHPEYERALIPGGTYPSNPRNVRTIGVRAVIVVTTRMADNLAYAITKGVFESFGDLRRLHPAFAMLSIDDMVRTGGQVPLHPGAIRYFRQRGWSQ